MKVYKFSPGVRILGIFACLGFIGLGVCGVVNFQISFATFVFFLPCVFLGVAGILAYLLSRIELDDKKIKIIGDLIVFKSEQSVFWNQIKRIESMFVLLEEISWISIYFDRDGKEQKIEIMITSYPRQFIKEFFENVPNSIEIYLYPSLKMKLFKICPGLEGRSGIGG